MSESKKPAAKGSAKPDKNTTRAPRPVGKDVAAKQDEADAERGRSYTEGDFLDAIGRIKPKPS